MSSPESEGVTEFHLYFIPQASLVQLINSVTPILSGRVHLRFQSKAAFELRTLAAKRDLSFINVFCIGFL